MIAVGGVALLGFMHRKNIAPLGVQEAVRPTTYSNPRMKGRAGRRLARFE